MMTSEPCIPGYPPTLAPAAATYLQSSRTTAMPHNTWSSEPFQMTKYGVCKCLQGKSRKKILACLEVGSM